MTTYKLYHYWRSSSSWRVRMALAFKGVPVEFVAVDLLTNEQSSPQHLARNPSGLVPCLEIPDNTKSLFLSESVAIIEWIEETHPEPRLLPPSPLERARIRELIQIINADTQPIQNLRVLGFVSPDQAERAAWARHWIEKGFAAFETQVKRNSGRFCFGDTISMADLFLIPQCYNAGRFNLDLDDFPEIRRIYQNVVKEKFCQDTAPDKFEPKK